jgi:hypothetical protein
LPALTGGLAPQPQPFALLQRPRDREQRADDRRLVVGAVGRHRLAGDRMDALGQDVDDFAGKLQFHVVLLKRSNGGFAGIWIPIQLMVNGSAPARVDAEF